MPSSPINSETTYLASYCVPFADSLSILALNVIGVIALPDVTPYIYHTNVVLPSSLFVISGSVYTSSPLLLVPAIYSTPSGIVTSFFNVTFSICADMFSFASNCGSTLYVTTSSFLLKS